MNPQTQRFMFEAVKAANATGHQIGKFFDGQDIDNNPVRIGNCCRPGCDKHVAYYIDTGEYFGTALESFCANPNPLYQGKRK